MADNIYKDSFAFVGAKAWHGKGSAILPTDTREQILAKAGFDFSLMPETAGYISADGSFVSVDGKVILRRSDTGAAVSVVGDKFKVHQPKQIMDFFHDYASSFGLKLETAGVLGKGERYFALARTEIDAALDASGKDRANLYALLATAADGTMRTTATPTAIRVVCANTWQIAINASDKAGTGSRQSHRSKFSADIAAKGLGFSIETHGNGFLAMAETLRKLNDVSVSDATAKAWLRDLLRPKAQRVTENTPEATRGQFNASSFADLLSAPATVVPHVVELDREVRGFDALYSSYQSAPGAMPGTARGLYEGVTHYVDHVRGTDDDKRLNSAVFGQGAETKARAWDAVQTFVS